MRSVKARADADRSRYQRASYNTRRASATDPIIDVGQPASRERSMSKAVCCATRGAITSSLGSFASPSASRALWPRKTPVAGAASTAVKPSARAARASSAYHSSCSATSCSGQTKGFDADSARPDSGRGAAGFSSGSGSSEPGRQGGGVGAWGCSAAGLPNVLARSMKPRYTERPGRRHTRAPSGTAPAAPAATTRPSLTTSMPFSMTRPGATNSRTSAARASAVWRRASPGCVRWPFAPVTARAATSARCRTAGNAASSTWSPPRIAHVSRRKHCCKCGRGSIC